MQPNPIKIGVFGHYGDLNLGEEATIEAVIYNITQIAPDAVVQCFSIYPDDSRERHKLVSFPIQDVSDELLESRRLRGTNRDVELSFSVKEPLEPIADKGLRRRLKRIYPLVFAVHVLRWVKQAVTATISEIKFAIRCLKQLNELDLLMIVGSNQCFDFCGGPWHYPYTLLKWSILAKISRTKLAFVSVGAGPIISRLSKLMIRGALALADYRSFRDKVSKKEIDDINADHDHDRVVPDLAFSLPDIYTHEKENVERDEIVIAINPMPIYDHRYWPQGDDSIYFSLIDKFIELTEWIEISGHRFFFYGTHPRDALAVEDIRKKLGTARFEFRDPEIYPNDVTKLMTRIAGADVAVAMRFHGIILPYVLCKPVLGLEYWKKTEDLMNQMDQSDYYVSKDIFLNKTSGFQLENITTKLDLLIKLRKREAGKIRSLVQRNQADLVKQYQEVLNIPDSKLRMRHAYN
jgi:polysaccharide pyruvyl transferase WcaK-like protein